MQHVDLLKGEAVLGDAPLTLYLHTHTQKKKKKKNKKITVAATQTKYPVGKTYLLGIYSSPMGDRG
jgi:hypothetical protein